MRYNMLCKRFYTETEIEEKKTNVIKALFRNYQADDKMVPIYELLIIPRNGMEWIFYELEDHEKIWIQERILCDIAGFVESCPSSKNYLSDLPRDLINYIAKDLTIIEKLNLAFSCEKIDEKLHTPKRVNPFINNKLLHLTDFGRRYLKSFVEKPLPKKTEIRINKWGNWEEANSHIVFNRLSRIAIGY